MSAISVGLVGYGFAGSVFHVPLIHATPKLRLAAIVTTRREHIEELPDVQVVPTVAELLMDASIQLVVIASPSGTHFDLTREALLAGKHVVVDKPLALTAAEAESLIALARRQQRVLTAFHNRRWDGDYLTVERAIADGRLGRVYLYESHYDRFRPHVRPVWREQAGPGSGILYDLGTHLIDQALHLFGMPQAVIGDVFAQRDGAQAVDYFHLVLKYERMRAILHGSMLVAAPGAHYAVHGDKGSFTKHGMDPQEEMLKAGKGPADPHWGIDETSAYGELVSADGTRQKIETLSGAYEMFYAGLAESIMTGAPPPVDPADAQDGLAVIEAGMRSAQERRSVDLG